MACFHPLIAYRGLELGPSGKRLLVFNKSQGIFSQDPIFLPCGQCVGCRLERSRQWAMRCVYESQLHQDNCFVTLTYDDDHLPSDGGLRKSDFQKFIKRVRRQFPGRDIRYFHCGEYGENFGRPHYHALLFGLDFADKQKLKDGQYPLFTSRVLSELWPFGFATLGALTFESAAYTARYVMKKVTGEAAKEHYERVVVETGEIIQLQPEYVTMSLKPAIGKRWYERFKGDVFPSDFLILNGQRMRPPKYFDKLYEVSNPEALNAIKRNRVCNALKHIEDGSPMRLRVREQVMSARLSMKVRHKEI